MGEIHSEKHFKELEFGVGQSSGPFSFLIWWIIFWNCAFLIFMNMYGTLGGEPLLYFVYVLASYIGCSTSTPQSPYKFV